MDNSRQRLIKCFTTVFPSLGPQTAPGATQDTVVNWDSVNTINLLNVIQEEFGIEVDYERLEEMTSFGRIHQYILDCRAR